MRDTITISFIAACVIAAVFHPWIGILAWTFIGIMNPHRYSWAASQLPVAAALAIATFIGILLTRDRVRVVITPTMAVFGAFVLWICITQPFSIFPNQSMDMWKRVLKIDLMIFVAAALLYKRRHILALVWVLVASLGFYGVKGGVFTVATGGNYLVWGPPDSFVEGNNELALALVMTIPLMRFLQMQMQSRLAKHAMTLAMLLTATSALGTHSRGALLALIAMAVVLWTRSKHKAASGVVLVLIGIGLIAFMPGEWEHRMGTILRYERDESALGRINAWWMAFNLASDRFFGGGFHIYRALVFQQYAPNPDDVHAAHSIYFQVLGEHGFVGLGLFVLMWFMVWRSAGWLRRNGAKREDSAWTSDLGSMIQSSIAGYAVGGAFLSLAYFDLPYNLLLLVVITRRWVEGRRWEEEPVHRAREQPPPMQQPFPTQPTPSGSTPSRT
jgi:probable O-glycosylation ligase (exosortase A-associated)